VFHSEKEDGLGKRGVVHRGDVPFIDDGWHRKRKDLRVNLLGRPKFRSSSQRQTNRRITNYSAAI
jgi:hypothetical protein